MSAGFDVDGWTKAQVVRLQHRRANHSVVAVVVGNGVIAASVVSKNLPVNDINCEQGAKSIATSYCRAMGYSISQGAPLEIIQVAAGAKIESALQEQEQRYESILLASIESLGESNDPNTTE